MPPDPESCAREWLAVAESDLLAAASLVGNPALPRQASYCAQQAAEKAIKAVLSRLNVAFPKTHDLPELLALLPADHPLCQLTIDWETLTEWAVRGRYPGTGPAAMDTEACEAITMAKRIVAVARGALLTVP